MRLTHIAVQQTGAARVRECLQKEPKVEVMLKNVLSAVAGAALFASVASAAVTDSTVGAVTSVDSVRGTITLEGGQTFSVAPWVSLASVKVGQQALVAYSQSGQGQFAESVLSGYYKFAVPTPAVDEPRND